MGRDWTIISPRTQSLLFQSTRPVWGATGGRLKCRLVLDISIHAPRVGRDAQEQQAKLTTILFQSTRPVWGATSASCGTLSGAVFQSTRPVWGATRQTADRAAAQSDFNPRAPCGARRRCVRTLYANTRFQSTRPVWGATCAAGVAAAQAVISIHAPRVGRDRSRSVKRARSNRISIHAPRVGRDSAPAARWRSAKRISIHAPRVGRDADGKTAPPRKAISIHAPRVGRDHSRRRRRACRRDFNPRAPCGARQQI